MDKSWKWKLVGVFCVLSSIVAFSFFGISVRVLYRIAAQSGRGPVFHVLSATPFLVLGLLALGGGIFALLGERIRLVLTGSLAASIGFPFLGIPATAITLRSGDISRKARFIVLVISIPAWIAIFVVLILAMGL